jgi:hypothetical protein
VANKIFRSIFTGEGETLPYLLGSILDIASLYLKIGSYHRAVEYVGKAQNRAHARNELAVLASQIESLKQQIQKEGWDIR